jgi:hypothetical protein
MASHRYPPRSQRILLGFGAVGLSPARHNSYDISGYLDIKDTYSYDIFYNFPTWKGPMEKSGESVAFPWRPNLPVLHPLPRKSEDDPPATP